MSPYARGIGWVDQRLPAHDPAPATDRGGQGPEALTASPGPYDPAELEALIEAVWSLDGDADPTRFDELLHAALVTLGRIALNPYAAERGMVTLLLRSMEQRALWGPDHPVRQP